MGRQKLTRPYFIYALTYEAPLYFYWFITLYASIHSHRRLSFFYFLFYCGQDFVDKYLNQPLHHVENFRLVWWAREKFIWLSQKKLFGIAQPPSRNILCIWIQRYNTTFNIFTELLFVHTSFLFQFDITPQFVTSSKPNLSQTYYMCVNNFVSSFLLSSYCAKFFTWKWDGMGQPLVVLQPMNIAL